MKNLFILLLCMTLSSTLIAEEEARERLPREADTADIEEVKATEEKKGDLSDSFMDAFGMGKEGSRKPSSGMNAGSAAAVNHVTTPFTPHMPK